MAFKEDLLIELIVKEIKAVEYIKKVILDTILTGYTGKGVYEVTVKDFLLVEHGHCPEEYYTTRQKYDIDSLTRKVEATLGMKVLRHKNNKITVQVDLT